MGMFLGPIGPDGGFFVVAFDLPYLLQLIQNLNWCALGDACQSISYGAMIPMCFKFNNHELAKKRLIKNCT